MDLIMTTYPSEKESTGIICKRWSGCPHPEICQDYCIDKDIKQDITIKKNNSAVYVEDTKFNPFGGLANIKLNNK